MGKKSLLARHKIYQGAVGVANVLEIQTVPRNVEKCLCTVLRCNYLLKIGYCFVTTGNMKLCTY